MKLQKLGASFVEFDRRVQGALAVCKREILHGQAQVSQTLQQQERTHTQLAERTSAACAAATAAACAQGPRAQSSEQARAAPAPQEHNLPQTI